MKWSDVEDIALALEQNYHEYDNKYIGFVTLRNLILSLENFDDDPNGCNEGLLEEIQLAWIDERSDK